MSNMINDLGQKFVRFILVVWPIAAVLVVGSSLLMYEDYMTTYHGYLLIPTTKVNKDWVPFIVALVPQAGQIVLFYLYATDTSKVWASKAALFLFLADSATDVYFKLDATWQGWPMLGVAIAETIVVFTIGSEFIFTVCLAFCAETFGEFIASGGKVLDSIFKGLLTWGGIESDTSQRRR